MPATEREPVAKTREEILAQPRPPKVCCKCGQIAVYWTWQGVGLVECRECDKEHEARDRIALKRMMQFGRPVTVPKSRVLETRKDDEV